MAIYFSCLWRANFVDFFFFFFLTAFTKIVWAPLDFLNTVWVMSELSQIKGEQECCCCALLENASLHLVKPGKPKIWNTHQQEPRLWPEKCKSPHFWPSGILPSNDLRIWSVFEILRRAKHTPKIQRAGGPQAACVCVSWWSFVLSCIIRQK